MVDALLFLMGFAPLILIGYCTVRLLECRRAVLLRIERWAYAAILGPTLTMFLVFLAERSGMIQFTLAGFLIVIGATLGALGALCTVRKLWSASPPAIAVQQDSARQWVKILLWILLCWSAVKIVVMTTLLVATPVYPDDAYNNWNMRAKVFFETKELTLDIPLGNEKVSSEGVSSYPPTVPLLKTWLVSLKGKWSEPLVNAMHIVWYLASLALLYGAVRRVASRTWALGAVYVLASIPLFLVHGTTPYADAFVAAHFFAAVLPALFALQSSDAAERASLLRIGAVSAALLIFTKNESLLMHLPPFLLLFGIALGLQWKKGRMAQNEILVAALWYGVAIAAIALPWIAFKWMHGLPFGNAKSVVGLDIAWQPNVVKSIVVTTFFEGNWLLLPVFFPLLLILRRRSLADVSVWLPASLALIVIAGQWALFLFTPLSAEALMQTASARGMIHVLPLTVLASMLLLRETMKK